MKKYLAFVVVGTFFSTVEEFLTVVVLRGELASYIFTLLVLFPLFLTLVYFSSKLIDRCFRHEQQRELGHYLAFGCLGLAFEWFVIGLSPWSNPAAHPLFMLLFQVGMFSFWATVAFAPRLFLAAHDAAHDVRRAVLWFYIPYFCGVYIVGLAAPQQLRFGTIIPLILFGYLFLNVFYWTNFARAFGSPESKLQEPAST
jgi:hypothetical protein